MSSLLWIFALELVGVEGVLAEASKAAGEGRGVDRGRAAARRSVHLHTHLHSTRIRL